MTCAEVQCLIAGSMGKGGPDACTRAERLAIGNHLRSCSTCGQFIDDQAKRLSDLVPPEVRAIVETHVLRQIATDHLDPEARS